MRILFALLALLLVSNPSTAESLYVCSSVFGQNETLIDHPNDTVRSVFLEVLQKAGYRPARFVLCQTDHYEPRMKPVYVSGSRLFAVMIPAYVATLSNAAIQGVLAHEVAHVPGIVGNLEFTGLKLELATDYMASYWVGKAPVIASLQEMKHMLSYFPQEDRMRALVDYEYRIRELESME